MRNIYVLSLPVFFSHRSLTIVVAIWSTLMGLRTPVQTGARGPAARLYNRRSGHSKYAFAMIQTDWKACRKHSRLSYHILHLIINTSLQKSPLVSPLPSLFPKMPLTSPPASCLWLYSGRHSAHILLFWLSFLFWECLSINWILSPNLVHFDDFSNFNIVSLKQKSKNLNLNGSSPVEEFG